MKISVNCPSYKRAEKVKTLDYLPFCNVYVCETEYQEYVNNHQKFKDNFIPMKKGIQGNVSRVRNFILDSEFKKGNDVVCIVDDDLSGIYHFEQDKITGFGYKQIKVDKTEFFDFLERYSFLCEQLGFKLWGVNLNYDKLGYKQSCPFNTKDVILGPFSCHMKGSAIRYDERLPLKEDYDLAIQHLNKYRGILRVNKYHYVCKQSEQTGGCAVYRNRDREREQLLLLRKKWGSDIIKIDTTNKGKSKKTKIQIDYNPIVRIPIKGV